MNKIILLLVLFHFVSCTNKDSDFEKLKEIVKNDKSISFVKAKALATIKEGFDAGNGYNDLVFIRDYNTFIELSLSVHSHQRIKNNLLIFFKMQGENGEILDVVMPKNKLPPEEKNMQYRSKLAPDYAGDKATVETDQESSLIQAVYKYIKKTGDYSILTVEIGGISVGERMGLAVNFLKKHRYSEKYGLIWGATTIDWGDVQPESDWGCYIDENTNYAIDIYDNAMLIVALNNLIELMPEMEGKFGQFKRQLVENSRKYLWDSKNKKFIPHIYLSKSPFPEDFNENEIFYFGGTAVAIEAGILSRKEILISLKEMNRRIKRAGASSIGLALEPAYPKGFIKNPQLTEPYSYQNGGDWTWFGGRMVNQLINYDLLNEAYEHLKPLLSRVVENDDFFEWYTRDNVPRGSSGFKGSAGVLYSAIISLEEKLNKY